VTIKAGTGTRETQVEERFARAFTLFPSPFAERVAENVLKRRLAANRIAALTNRAIAVLGHSSPPPTEEV
jgi:hypothetical protein